MLFTDTDSQIYEVETDDAYQQMVQDHERFDLASYSRASELYAQSNTTVCFL